MVRFGDWLDTLSPEERTKYRILFPESVTWKGWWDDEDSGEVLEHGDFWVDAWQPGGQPKYTRQWLQQEFPAGRTRKKWRGQNLLGFYGTLHCVELQKLEIVGYENPCHAIVETLAKKLEELLAGRSIFRPANAGQIGS